jgi:prepilin-type N-terminal cleavage/methylation domain-containing protein
MRTHLQQRAGFTLIEMIVATALLMIIMAMGVSFFLSETHAVQGHAGRMDASQNARYALNMTDLDLRMSGAGVVDAQPILVQADKFALTFNANLVTHDDDDIGAVYVDPDMAVANTTALTKTTQVTLPLSAKAYPDTNYFQGSGGGALPSLAETISYWLAPDPAPAVAGDYALFRKVNRDTARIVARGLVYDANKPAFRYFKRDDFGVLVEIAANKLPLFHTAKIHGSLADSASSALTDSILVVRLHWDTRYKDRDNTIKIRTIEANVRLMNAGLIRHSTCGEAPVFGVAVNAVANASPAVVLTWNKASDEGGGEKDIERYAIYRRLPADAFTEPFASVAAGSANYSFTDTQVVKDEQWVYGVSAQDCTPANSSVVSTGTVIIP